MNSRQTTHAFNTSFAAVICHVRGISPSPFHRIRQSNLFRKRHQLRSHKQNLTSFLAIDKGDPHDHQEDNLNLNKQDDPEASYFLFDIYVTYTSGLLFILHNFCWQSLPHKS